MRLFAGCLHISLSLPHCAEISGGNVGLAITQILGLISLCQWGVRQTAEIENEMTSVERIMEYVNLDGEEETPSEKQIDVPRLWSTNGSIEFNNLSLKYSENGGDQLKLLNAKVEPGEKVAIIGRTGAGKSSIVNALLRMAYNSGTVKIDSVDIASIPLTVLRKKLSIIPQDAFIFSGTMRENLDPFRKHADYELWTVLEKVRIEKFAVKIMQLWIFGKKIIILAMFFSFVG